MYYFSCMLLFNLIYLSRICYDFGENVCEYLQNMPKFYTNIATLAVVSVSLIISMITTLLVFYHDDSPSNKQTKGIELQVLRDITGSNYLGKFSLLVLTGLSIPVNKDWLSLMVYLLVFIAIGIIFVKKNLAYINPILAIFNYSVYECVSKDEQHVVVLAKNANAKVFRVRNNSKNTYIVKDRIDK